VHEARTSRLKQRTDPLGQLVTRTYAKDDRLTALAYGNTVNPTPAVSFAYDPYFPRVTSMSDGNGTTSYRYIQTGVTGALQLLSEDGPFGHDKLEYDYDALGRMRTRKIDGQLETFAYDQLGRVTRHSGPLGNFTLSYLGATDQLARRALQIGSNDPRWITDWRHGDNLADRRLEAIDHSPGSNQTDDPAQYRWTPR
jgi:YD repeat-containing protein